jgi:hypothetical protein
MSRAESLGAIPKEQAGSRKHHRSVLSALNKVLTMDLLRLKRQSGALCSNDAKSCYDRIVHWVAALSMRRLGLQIEPTLEMLKSIQQAWHYIATAYGESKQRYGGFRWPPLQGVGQGNGAGPMIWAVISAVLIAIMKRHGHGISILTPLTLTAIYLVCFAFVDDTDVVHGGKNTKTKGEEVIPEMQEVVDRWEGSIRATGGALVPSKSYWYLIDFVWKNGQWKYRSIKSMPGDISIRGVDGIRVTLERLEPSEARETLGVFIAMDGNWRAEIVALLEKTSTFADQLRVCFIQPNDAWHAFITTIMKSLEYPMEATCIDEKGWDTIMKPILGIVLQRSKFAKNFPRDVFYSTSKYQGLSVMHPWYRQQIVHLITLCKETFNGTPTGELLLANAEQLRLEIGLPDSFTSAPLDLVSPYMTRGWLKDLLLFLHQFHIKLEDPLPKLRKLRANDRFLMEIFLEQGYRGSELETLNGCRQALHVTTLADISSMDGVNILRWAWDGKPGLRKLSSSGWPREPKINRDGWTLWQQALGCLLRSPRGLKLREPLGSWLTPPPPSWKWFYSPSEERLYSRQGHLWRSFRKRFRRTGLRNAGGDFESTRGIATEVPADLERADVEQYRNFFRLMGSASWFATPRPDRPTSLDTARDSLDKRDIWAAEILIHDDDGATVASSIQDGTAYAVSDGSYKDNRGTSAFLLESGTGDGRIIGMNEIPGAAKDQSPYRSELGGISGVLATVDCLCRRHQIKTGSITCRLDGFQAMYHASGPDPLDPQRASFDLLVDIRNKIKSSPITWKFLWVEGHQQERHGEEDFWGKLNNICDSVAKAFWAHVDSTRDCSPNHRFGNEGWGVSVQGKKLAKMPMTDLYDSTFGATKSKQYWSDKHTISAQIFARIDWEACGMAMKGISFGKKRWLVKHLSGFCAVGRMMLIREQWPHDKCPLCFEPNETVNHVIDCRDPRARLQWIRSVDKLGVKMQTIKTDPDIINVIRKRLARRHSRPFTLPQSLPDAVKRAVYDQDSIGWTQFLRGRLSKKWEDAQERWIIRCSTKWKRSSKKWLTKLVQAIWEVSREMWEHRNGVLHHPLHPWKLRKVRDLTERIKTEFAEYDEASFMPKDRRLFRSSAQHMLEHHTEGQRELWVQSVDMARLRMMQTKILASTGSSIFMQNWLLYGSGATLATPATPEGPEAVSTQE